MTFKELLEVNRTPFDECLFERLYQNYMGFGRYSSDIFAMILFIRYMEKFVEIYELDIYIPVLEYPYKNYNIREEGGEMENSLPEYIYLCEEIFGEVACTNGFEVFQFPMDPCEWPAEVNGNDEKETFDNYIRFLKNEWPSLSSLIEENKENILDSSCYMECSEMFILKNEELGIFKEICKEYRDIIDRYLLEEEKAIESILEDFGFPLYLGNIAEKGYCDNFYYIYFDLGSDGYNYLDFSYINWNWIITCIVLHRLIEDFREKLKSLLCEQDLEEVI